jgi:hypothetical protein
MDPRIDIDRHRASRRRDGLPPVRAGIWCSTMAIDAADP